MRKIPKHLIESYLLKKFHSSYVKDEKTRCWTWTKALQADGYGILCAGRSRVNISAHRYSLYIINRLENLKRKRGELMVDHICRNRACVNPEHLRLVDSKINSTENSISPPAINKRKVNCQRGHPLSGYNLSIKKNGERNCKLCRNYLIEKHRFKNGKYVNIIKIKNKLANFERNNPIL